MITLRLSETSDGRYSASLASGEIIVANSKTPTADACKVLNNRGETGKLRVSVVGSFFACDIQRTASYRPSALARRITSRPWLAGASLAGQQ